MPRDISDFPNGWERELERVSRVVFSRKTEGDEVMGILERLETIERLIKYGIAGASLIGGLTGSLLTMIAQELFKAQFH